MFSGVSWPPAALSNSTKSSKWTRLLCETNTVTVLLAVKLFNYWTWKKSGRLGTPGYLISILNLLSVLSHPIIWDAQRGLPRRTPASFAIKETIMTKTAITLSITVGAGGICLPITSFWLDTLIKGPNVCVPILLCARAEENTLLN